MGNVWTSIASATGEDLSCSDYADIAFLKAIHYYRAGQYKEAKACYEHGIIMFDGYGFKDGAFYDNRHATYKLALWKVASDITGYGDAKEALRIIAVMRDPNTGEVYTHYRQDMSIGSMANVETTALAIMAYNSKPQEKVTDNNNNLPLEYIIIGVIMASMIAVLLSRWR